MYDKTILIADNSIINRIQMGGILASEYNILEADNGRDALDIMCERGEQGIDVVLLDLHMPGQTGFDVLAEKQANPAIADIPVIVITADSVTAARDTMHLMPVPRTSLPSPLNPKSCGAAFTLSSTRASSRSACACAHARGGGLDYRP